jgi:hypothetical protein
MMKPIQPGEAAEFGLKQIFSIFSVRIGRGGRLPNKPLDAKAEKTPQGTIQCK